MQLIWEVTDKNGYIYCINSYLLYYIFFLFSELFDNYMQQDAHEFLNYLLNRVAELLQGKIQTIFNFLFGMAHEIIYKQCSRLRRINI